MVARLSLIASIALVFVCLFTSKQAPAASFDCSAATKPLEKLICADAELSKLDEELATAYGVHLAQYSQEAQIKLRQSQRSWLKMVRAVCGYRLDHPGRNGETALGCLKQEYADRLPEFTVRAGSDPYLIFFVTRDEAVPMATDAGADEKGSFVRHQLSYPQIDAPRTAENERWNRHIAEKAEDDFKDPGLEGDLDTADLQVGYSIKEVLPGFISGTSYIDYYFRGSPHPNSFSGSSNILLTSGKDIEAKDIFPDDQPWRDTLAKICADKMAPNARFPFEAKAIADQAADANNWEISSDRLTVHVDFYLMAGGWNGAGTAEIPWRELKPYLRPDLPLALKLD